MSPLSEPIELDVVLSELRSGNARPTGPRFWRSLEELAGNEAFERLIADELATQAVLWPPDMSRRKFLALVAASLAVAGGGGCSVRPAPSKDIVPYVRSPEQVVPGQPLFYATSMIHQGSAIGLLVESHLGRPTKIEGNPDHPASLGATDVFAQAAVWTLYDPDRSKIVLDHGRPSTWDDAQTALGNALSKLRDKKGRGLRLLSETIVSPSVGRQLDKLLADYPDAVWHQYEPLHRDHARQASQRAFGKPLDARYDFAQADVVLSLDADFLATGVGKLRYSRDFMNRRRVHDGGKPSAATMNRLYVVETAVSCTGAKADHRLAVRPSEVAGLTRAIASQLGVLERAAETSPRAQWVDAVAKDLAAHRGRSLIIAGDGQSPEVHLLAHALNDHLGNVGKTVSYTQPAAHRAVDQTASLKELLDAIAGGDVEVLVMLGGNPVYDAPADFEFARHLEKVGCAHLGLFEDETSRLCHWHLPEAHFLEAWGDARAFDGTASLVQPLIDPLYQGRSALEVLAMLTEGQYVPGRELVQAHWRDAWHATPSSPGEIGGDFQRRWQTALHDGLIEKTAFEPAEAKIAGDWKAALANRPAAAAESSKAKEGELELVFVADPSLGDGRFANNGWLQELPKPLTKLTWGNAAIMSPATAKAQGLSFGSYAHGGEHGGYYMPVVELQLDGRAVRAPIWIMPGHADGTVTVHLGHGRDSAGAVGGDSNHAVGINAYRLRTAAAPWSARGLRVTKTDDRELMACTQQHHSMENRELVRVAGLDEYREHPHFADERKDASPSAEPERKYPELTLYEPFDYAPPKHKWGMAIDLTACFGCNACVIACQAENNIPVVGQEQVAAGREMHWIRIDRYLEGPEDDPRSVHFQPVPCMHCENAPCEYVCPVEATVHSSEGLNEMVYNRCVGTRFCSNNCPYKVRRFNFFAYADFDNPTKRMQYNPDVTVRSRGVMEKCSYCVQRLRHAEIGAELEHRKLADGEVLTACQAACPAQAIAFGDMNDRASAVAQWKHSPLNYGLLADQNTQPRTTYLAGLRNPNPALEAT